MPPSSRPAAGQSHGWTDGRMDGWMDGWTDGAAPLSPGAQAGRRQEVAVGVSSGCPLPAAWPGDKGSPMAAPGGAALGIFCFLFSLPVRSLAGCFPCRMDANGCLGALTPPRLWQLRQRGSEMPPSPATAPILAAGAERRGGHCWGGGVPQPHRPPLGPRLGRGAGAAFSLGGDSFNRFLLGFLSEGIFIFCTKPAIVNTFEEKLKKKPTKKNNV